MMAGKSAISHMYSFWIWVVNWEKIFQENIFDLHCQAYQYIKKCNVQLNINFDFPFELLWYLLNPWFIYTYKRKNCIFDLEFSHVELSSE